MSKGIFIPDITVEMFRNASLEGVETLLVEGEMHDVDMPKWIPCSKQLPEKDERVLVTAWGDVDIAWIDKYGLWQTEEYTYDSQDDVLAWMPLPEKYKGE